MTKPTKWLCAQRRLRSAWASAQSDQSLHCCLKKAWVLSYPLSAQWRLWSDWADAKADLSLRWAHTHFVGFVMLQLICHLPMEDGNNMCLLNSSKITYLHPNPTLHKGEGYSWMRLGLHSAFSDFSGWGYGGRVEWGGVGWGKGRGVGLKVGRMVVWVVWGYSGVGV